MTHPLQKRFDDACEALTSGTIIIATADNDHSGKTRRLSADEILSLARSEPEFVIAMHDDVVRKRVCDVYGLGNNRYYYIASAS